MKNLFIALFTTLFFTSCSQNPAAVLRVPSVDSMTTESTASNQQSDTSETKEIMVLSTNKFRWEMKNDADSMAGMLDDRFIGISSTGIRRTKSEYLANIKNPATIHNSMDIQETKVTLYGSTVVLTGKGVFVITSNNVTSTQHLFYIQVYAKDAQGWKMIALQGSRFPD
jgi:hypothetical protein